MKRALLFTLLGLALVVVLFAVTWWSLPTRDCGDRGTAASLFDRGLTYGATAGSSRCVHLDDLKTRIEVVYGDAAVLIIIVGLAVVVGQFLIPRLSVPSETGSDAPLPASPIAGIATDRGEWTHARLRNSPPPKEGRTLDQDNVRARKRRLWLKLGAAVAVFILVGHAFGAARRSPRAPPSSDAGA